jgi:hypothetical protein
VLYALPIAVGVVAFSNKHGSVRAPESVEGEIYWSFRATLGDEFVLREVRIQGNATSPSIAVSTWFTYRIKPI